MTDYDPEPRLRRPFSLQSWISDHRHEMVPPVSNRQVWREADMIVMMVGGGNHRNDFHIDPREEFWVEFLFRDDTLARVKMEVGDLKAAQSFLSLGLI